MVGPPSKEGSPGKPGWGHPNPEHNVWSSLGTSRRAGFLLVALTVSCCWTHNHYLCLLFPLPDVWLDKPQQGVIPPRAIQRLSQLPARLDLQTQHNHFAMNSMVSAGPVFLGQENDEGERGWGTEGRNRPTWVGRSSEHDPLLAFHFASMGTCAEHVVDGYSCSRLWPRFCLWTLLYVVKGMCCGCRSYQPCAVLEGRVPLSTPLTSPAGTWVTELMERDLSLWHTETSE